MNSAINGGCLGPVWPYGLLLPAHATFLFRMIPYGAPGMAATPACSQLDTQVSVASVSQLVSRLSQHRNPLLIGVAPHWPHAATQSAETAPQTPILLAGR